MAGLGVAVASRVEGSQAVPRRAAAGLESQPSSTVPAEPAPQHDAKELDKAFGALVAPVAIGTQLGPITVAGLRVDERKLGVVTITGAAGSWDVEIARRTDDDAALNPLAMSKHFCLYLRNGGTGHKRTDEDVARAVLAIADAVRRNEENAPLVLASRAEMWASTGYQQKA